MDLISIIVPIYNAEKVIKRCIESISRQSYEMLEIILVDDGSTDQSLEICEDMSEKDSRIKIIHQNNGGVSRARNTGLKKATGQYIMMVDSDDYLYERAVELMLREIKKNKADLAICGFERGMDEAFPFSIDLSLKSSVIDNREALNRIYKNDYCALQYVAPWAKLYARRLFDNIIYPEGKIFEDIYITHHILYKCGRIAVLPQRMVYYSFCDNSLMNKPFHLGKLDYLEAIRKLRIRIMKDVEKKEYQTLLVTSSIPGEGKTTLSANLAISIAQQGKKVLLVDCDLRNPSIAGVMNEQEPHPGLGSVLKKEVPLSEAITNVKLPKERTNENGSLHVIFGGAPDGENSLLIGSGRMRALIEALKSKYDIIILDTAPSELLADAPLLGKYVDAALYVIRYDYTKLREIREGVESLALSGIDMLGYVFNGDNSSGGQGYGYGYRRYGNYGSYGSHYGSYGKYGAYGHYGKMEKGSTDKFGRVIKD